MNYLTNYYKNLSEQLQQKVNLLESYLQQVNEDLEPGTVMQGYGSSTSSTTTNQNDNPDLNNFLQAWGSSDPTYDYNGDGVVDGNDLGIHLSRMLDRGTRPTSPVRMASTVAAGTPGTETLGGGVKTARSAKALDQPGLSKGPVNRMVDFGQGAGTVEKKNQTTQKLMPKAPYSQGTNLSTAKFSPSQTSSDIINAKFERMASNKGSGGFDVETETSRPKVPYSPQVSLGTDTLKTNITPSAGTRTQQPPATAMGTLPPGYGPNGYHVADYNQDGFVNSDDQGQLLNAWGTQNSQYDLNGDGFVDASDLGIMLAAYGEQPFVDPNGGGGGASTDTNQTSDQDNIPYWMSGKSTNVDTGFRSMQRRRKK